MKKFKVYGDYGYTSENLLAEFDSAIEAKEWVDTYTRWGDMGGYYVIEVAWFTENGEFEVEYAVHADDNEDDFAYEGDDDFALVDEF